MGHTKIDPSGQESTLTYLMLQTDPLKLLTLLIIFLSQFVHFLF